MSWKKILDWSSLILSSVLLMTCWWRLCLVAKSWPLFGLACRFEGKPSQLAPSYCWHSGVWGADWQGWQVCFAFFQSLLVCVCRIIWLGEVFQTKLGYRKCHVHLQITAESWEFLLTNKVYALTVCVLARDCQYRVAWMRFYKDDIVLEGSIQKKTLRSDLRAAYCTIVWSVDDLFLFANCVPIQLKMCIRAEMKIDRILFLPAQLSTRDGLGYFLGSHALDTLESIDITSMIIGLYCLSIQQKCAWGY